jgi:hypothetical protein
LDTLAGTDLNVPLCNGMSFLDLAEHCGKTVSGEWLIAHGVECSVLSAWDFGWRDRAAALLSNSPEAINQLYGGYRYTLLHVAVERNDNALAKLALSADPDLRIRNKIHQGTALEWAQHLQLNEIEKLIDRYI